MTKKSKWWLLPVLLIAGLSGFGVLWTVFQLTRITTESLLEEGSRLSNRDAENLEEILARNPEELSYRTKLLGYYAHAGNGRLDDRQINHILWIINNRPTSEIAALIGTRASLQLSPHAYSQARQAWYDQAEAQKSNRVVLLNAMRFVDPKDTGDVAESILKHANDLSPEDGDSLSNLAHYYLLRYDHESDATRKEVKAKSARFYKRAVNAIKAAPPADLRNREVPIWAWWQRSEEWQRQNAVVTKEIKNLAVFQDASWAILESGEKDLAKTFAGESLLRLKTLIDSELFTSGDHGKWFRIISGDDISEMQHRGNLILCKIALADNDMSSARNYLLEAARISGSPVLDSFGPDLILAKELLQRGEKGTVIEYLELCSKFWESDRDDIPVWEEAIKKGRNPDFGIAADNDQLKIRSTTTPGYWNTIN